MGSIVKQYIFEKIHTGNLVYNTCWEDPRCDRQLLQLDEKSKVVMLTSAGCNALDYLLDDPASIACVDMNPRQNALLELKKTLFNTSNHDTLFSFFGNGAHAEAREIYQDQIQYGLEGFAKEYWRKNMAYFTGKGIRKSFYYHGSSGSMAFVIKKFLAANPAAKKLVHRLFECTDADLQRSLYYRLEPYLLNKFLTYFLNLHLAQSMLGVPESQQILAKEKYRDGMSGYIKDCFRRVFAEIPVEDNYFWKLYFFGAYSNDCCPNYLKAEYFDTLRQKVGRITTHSMSLNDFLKENPGKYTHFVLLDHQDWLASHNRQALHEEWELIFKNSAPQAKVLFRSASPNVDFLPSFAKEKLKFDNQAASKQHNLDRVGTYASVHLATV